MKLEKRSSDETEEAPVQEPASRKKPVVVYIMILFIAAFLLMALSFFMHQRSNTQALGELQHSVSALQEVQATQDKNIQLQEELADANDELEAVKGQLSQAQSDTLAAQNEVSAMVALYTLQQQYAAADYDACRITLQSMEDQNLVEQLPTSADAGVTAPSLRYQQLKEAVLNQPAD